MAQELVTAATSAGRASGYSQGTRELATYFSPAATASRAEARLIKEQADQALQVATNMRPTGEQLGVMSETMQLELQNARDEARRVQSQLVRQRTYDSFRRYEADGDVRHINTLLEDMRQDPIGSRLFSDTVRVEPLSENDTDLLEQLGVDWEHFSASPQLKKGFVKAILTDGSAGILPMEMLYAGTEYDRYQRMQELEESRQRAEILRLAQLRTAASSSAAEREAALATNMVRPADIPEDQWVLGNPEYDAVYLSELRDARQRSRQPAGTALEREARRMTELMNPNDPEWVQGNPEFDAAMLANQQSLRAEESRTSGMKEQDEIESTKDSVDALARQLGKESFFDIQPGSAEMSRFERQIQRIQRLGKVELSTQDRNTIMNIRELLSMGDIAKEITARETGLIDRAFNTLGRYISDNTSGTAQTAAYQTFRNTLQHALYGASLTATEVENMNKQLGTTGQQLGPLLAQMTVALEQVKARLESIAQLNDSYVSHYYLGQDAARTQSMIDAIDGSIAELNRYSQSADGQSRPSSPSVGDVRQPAGAVPTEQADREAQLDSLFNEIMGAM